MHVNPFKKRFIAAVLGVTAILFTSISVAGDAISKEQAIEKALQAHSGEVTKAYQETRRGQEVWEVQIQGDDGKKWITYYAMSGELVQEEAE
jgi:uncharacterized membrane protein YkoI